MIQWGLQVGSGSKFSMELQVDSSDDFQWIRFGAAACGSGGSSTGHCGRSSGDSCRWGQPVVQWELQVGSGNNF